MVNRNEISALELTGFKLLTMVFENQELDFRAIKYDGGSHVLRLDNLKLELTPQEGGGYGVGPHEILVKVYYAALNPVDLVGFNTLLPFIGKNKEIGNDYSGEIVSIGEDAEKKTGFKTGDKVCGLLLLLSKGTLSEYILLDSRKKDEYAGMVHIPQNLSLAEASCWPLVFGTAYNALKKVGAIEGGKILIIGGATSVGRYCVQLSKEMFKYNEVVAVCSSSSADHVKSLGADKIIDYTRYGSIESPVIEEAREGKFDSIIDCCGNSDLFDRIKDILKTGAKKSHYVTLVGDYKMNYLTTTFFTLLSNNLWPLFRMISSKLGLLPYVYTLYLLSIDHEWVSRCKELIEEDHGKVEIDHIYDMDNSYEAIKHLQSGRANGKVVIRVSQ